AESPAAALADAPVLSWPVQVVADDGRRVGLAEALGPGGPTVERLLGDLHCGVGPMSEAELTARATTTPAGPVDLPLAMVPLAEGVERSGGVDRAWFDEVDHRRSVPRSSLLAAGRGVELEAALHVAMLLATEVLDPADDSYVDAHVASGAQLWILAGAVAWTLVGSGANPFGPWAELVAAGLWPIGPSGGHLVVSAGATTR
ncbi:MAG: hypothetical protein M3535_05480, partial [Actinomycetota bacterium]|nr:hypothetical protein [Actinomycetota bacterium]